ncbi:hypothetical protein [Methylotenera sp.]|uniref:hypothetical protein n=1 Tax=Methylotenera sp. TaxID=2051956 RepID=UPI0025D2E2BE|nr:hypothetical protein [Methylotenera sp.]
MAKIVTERDFRLPEFRDADPNDYEFRDDGKVVRKDRWKTGVHNIASAVGANSRDGFEIDDIVERVRKLVGDFDRLAKAAGVGGDDGYNHDQLVLALLDTLDSKSS